MTVCELIRLLKTYDPDSEVRIASQPRWPMEYRVHDVVETSLDKEDVDDDLDDDDRNDDEDDEPEIGVVYIVEGDQLGYLGETARRDVGWGR